jgi:hypothetical protein
MKKRLLIVAVSMLVISSCSTTNKASKTVDDVYYSPASGLPTSAKHQTIKDEYDEYISSNDDRYLQMKVQNRALWSSIDDYSYWNAPLYSYNSFYGMPYYNNYFSMGYYNNPFIGYYNPYFIGMSYGMGWYNPYLSFGYTYGYNYSPYYSSVFVSKNPVVRTPAINTSRPNLNSYNNRYYNISNNSNTHINNNNNNVIRSYNNTNSNVNRPVYTPPPAPVRSYSPEPAPAPSSGGGGGGVSRPARNG